jgi:hypothetical protein
MTREEKLIVDRLKATYRGMEEMEAVFDIVAKTLALREAELSEAKKLCVRAAEALESYHLEDFEHNLIEELRKAAQ